MKLKPFDRKTTFFKNLRICNEGAFPYWKTSFINKNNYSIISCYPMYPYTLENKRALVAIRSFIMEQYQRSDEYRCNPWRYR